MIASLIVGTLVSYYLLDSLAKFLNLKSIRTEVPPEFADIYDSDRYRRSQSYTKANTLFDIISQTVALASLFIFWFLGGFSFLDDWLRSFHLPVIWTGLLYFATLCAGRELLSLPFVIFHTFKIEQKFGFNRTTPKTFAVDRLKEWALSALVAGPVLAVILALFELFGLKAWIYAWLFTAFFSLVLVYVAPTVILPIFFKFSPLQPGALKDEITALCKAQNFPIRELSVIDGSRRSSKANAFFAGFGANKRIALYDTLIANHSSEELVAILAHEIGHFKRRHVLQHFLFGQLNLFLLFYFASLCVSNHSLFEAFRVTKTSYYVGLALFFVLMKPAAILLGIVANFWSRKHEFEADKFAAGAVGTPEPLITALKKLSKDSLSNLTPHPLLVGLHFTHPPVLTRIRALSATGPNKTQSFEDCPVPAPILPDLP